MLKQIYSLRAELWKSLRIWMCSTFTVPVVERVGSLGSEFKIPTTDLGSTGNNPVQPKVHMKFVRMYSFLCFTSWQEFYLHDTCLMGPFNFIFLLVQSALQTESDLCQIVIWWIRHDSWFDEFWPWYDPCGWLSVKYHWNSFWILLAVHIYWY